MLGLVFQWAELDLVPALDDPGIWRVFGGTLYSLTAAALFSLGNGTQDAYLST